MYKGLNTLDIRQIQSMRRAFNSKLDEKMELVGKVHSMRKEIEKLTEEMRDLDDRINIKAGIYEKS